MVYYVKWCDFDIKNITGLTKFKSTYYFMYKYNDGKIGRLHILSPSVKLSKYKLCIHKGYKSDTYVCTDFINNGEFIGNILKSLIEYSESNLNSSEINSSIYRENIYKDGKILDEYIDGFNFKFRYSQETDMFMTEFISNWRNRGKTYTKRYVNTTLSRANNLFKMNKYKSVQFVFSPYIYSVPDGSRFQFMSNISSFEFLLDYIVSSNIISDVRSVYIDDNEGVTI